MYDYDDFEINGREGRIMMMMVMVSMVVGGEWLGLLVLPITLECPNHSPRWP